MYQYHNVLFAFAICCWVNRCSIPIVRPFYSFSLQITSYIWSWYCGRGGLTGNAFSRVHFSTCFDLQPLQESVSALIVDLLFFMVISNYLLFIVFPIFDITIVNRICTAIVYEVLWFCNRVLFRVVILTTVQPIKDIWKLIKRLVNFKRGP